MSLINKIMGRFFTKVPTKAGLKPKFVSEHVRMISPMQVKAGNDEFVLSVGPNNGIKDILGISLKNSQGRECACEDIMMSKNNPIEGLLIRTEMDQRRKGLAEILRLGSIIEMFENNCPSIRILSLDTALKFHTKYKFRPILKTDKEIKGAVELMKATTAGNVKLLPIAEKLDRYEQESVDTAGFSILSSMQRRKKVNQIFTDFLKNVTENKIDLYSQLNGVEMILEKEDVLANKKFFNGLFSKHKIDYKV